MKVRDVLRVRAKDGWVLRNKEGSHRQLVHPTKPGKVTVPGHPSIEVPPGFVHYETVKYAVICEKSSNGWGASIPDLPGCLALGFTYEKTENLIREALQQHLRAMREDGDLIPEPSRMVGTLEVA